MVALYKKMNLIDSMLKKGVITDKIACDFFEEILADGFLLQRVSFHTRPLTTVKYSIVIDTKKKFVLCRINGKYYKNERYIKYILRALKESWSTRVDVCIISKKEKFNQEYFNVCVDMDLVEDVVNEAYVDFMLNDIRKNYIKKLIDEALDSGDKDRFNELQAEYMNLNM